MRSLRRQIALVSQDPILFDDTDRQQHSLWQSERTHDQFEDAAKKAFAHDFILVKGGYETKIGDLGFLPVRRRKAANRLASAILRDPSICSWTSFPARSTQCPIG